ncbi:MULTISPECIES: TetR/AcrR family transcriptional regulator [Alcanivorax]|jgi:AcrR family transcriptional regulator|uniref:TetR/AcrR family transcriptional regulator n=2 Tax=Alcanivoracaceae TaxID=224372 RepID=UPI000C4D6E6B|nr:TetR/AcrR family transcriptional regulator [Alcanivorax jadensis]MBG32316.1 TetR family transcriptional regulator [Alcanivorax sp.]MBG33862.1 TetR family transcriptional regulator [Alcanivorax sp.]MDF1636855.1 TetR/AcrR family transcriptional regulator [Alcanivorax jadensis]|tara:strand:+ start:492 stop:1127 length:636 start_codon:yes stop_codon:yes gene_type:complete
MAYRETANVKARKAAQRDHLLHSAEQLVREGGFANLTMQTLAVAAGVGVGTLYRYFDNKAVLAAEVFRVATEREVAAVAQAMEHAGSFPERLSHVLQVFVQRAQAAPRLAWSLIAEPVDPAVDAERLTYRQRYAALYQQLLSDGVSQGELPIQDTAISAAALVGAIAEALVGPLSDPLPKANLAESLTQFCLRAVGASPAQADVIEQPQTA